MATEKRKTLIKQGKKKFEDARKATQFKKGVAQAAGVEKGETTPEQREAKVFNKAMVGRFITHYALEPIENIEKIVNDPKATMIEKIICNIILKSYKTADTYRLDFLLNRAIGKVKDEVDLTVNDRFKDMTDEQILEMRNEVAKKNIESLRQMSMTAEERANANSKSTPTGDSTT